MDGFGPIVEMTFELGLQGLGPRVCQTPYRVFFELPLKGEPFVLDPIEVQPTHKRLNRGRWLLSCSDMSGKGAQKVKRRDFLAAGTTTVTAAAVVISVGAGARAIVATVVLVRFGILLIVVLVFLLVLLVLVLLLLLLLVFVGDDSDWNTIAYHVQADTVLSRNDLQRRDAIDVFA